MTSYAEVPAADHGCSRCGNRHGHDALSGAECIYRAAQLADLTAYAATLHPPVRPVAVQDLWATLRSGYQGQPDPSAYQAVRRVLDLGWRPAVGVAAGEVAR